MYMSADDVDDSVSPKGTIAQQLIDLIPVAATAYQQRMQMKMQLDRANRGLPPLDMSTYTQPMQARVGVDNRTMYLGIGAAAFLGLVFFMRGRR